MKNGDGWKWLKHCVQRQVVLLAVLNIRVLLQGSQLPASKEVLWKNKECSQNRSPHPVPLYCQV